MARNSSPSKHRPHFGFTPDDGSIFGFDVIARSTEANDGGRGLGQRRNRRRRWRHRRRKGRNCSSTSGSRSGAKPADIPLDWLWSTQTPLLGSQISTGHRGGRSHIADTDSLGWPMVLASGRVCGLNLAENAGRGHLAQADLAFDWYGYEDTFAIETSIYCRASPIWRSFRERLLDGRCATRAIKRPKQ